MKQLPVHQWHMLEGVFYDMCVTAVPKTSKHFPPLYMSIQNDRYLCKLYNITWKRFDSKNKKVFKAIVLAVYNKAIALNNSHELGQ